ncbi:hypothetical protein GGI00_003972 [Coemansia sp. RSA 2681]|nr:hypothetical protein GGI00_003972 [Coemansia sp. RSA 2681]
MYTIDYSQPLAPRHMLNGSNYSLWKTLVLDVLDELGLTNALRLPSLLSEEEKADLSPRKVSRACAILLKSMDPNIASAYCGITCPFFIMAELEEKYGLSEDE